MPLHQLITEELRRQIAGGELSPGEPLPGETELMRRFGVARGTIRQALASLRADGSVVGSRGKPPVVGAPRLAQPFSELLSFSAWVRSLGQVPSGVVRSFARRRATAAEAAAFALPVGGSVYHLVRIRCADDVPLMVERSTFPPRVGDLVAQLDLTTQSIYEQLALRGLRFASARQAIDALPASVGDARDLGVPARTPLLRVRREAFAISGEPLERSEDRYIAGRVVFSIDHTTRETSVSRRLERTGT
ncbi:MAG TPA: GntR family transcriptional regulator [Candidatus Limnocylindria bacterium]|nr:GntR family transcriptional regulator [Candidatus Limnocylindria bacterium]